ncbi:MAG: GNAT family N-acetyltransferase [Gammaproteobacteria bacterium TMED134]|nr:MAG: GNAT family N-acetyltransferase [Gammaproteobacteria bacterium TMED134]RPG47535.1 MAG: GNAT family N-acetyltransferase [Gammaproteobacteria bacterium TMED134]
MFAITNIIAVREEKKLGDWGILGTRFCFISWPINASTDSTTSAACLDGGPAGVKGFKVMTINELATESNYSIRPATEADREGLHELVPLLADFDIPPNRRAEHLWQGDAQTVDRFFSGEDPHVAIDVAATADNVLLGLAITRIGEELLSHTPSAHLEALVVAPTARGLGLGRKLLATSEARARSSGAESLTLHVFNRNQRAKSLYADAGFDQELIRAIKWLT